MHRQTKYLDEDECEDEGKTLNDSNGCRVDDVHTDRRCADRLTKQLMVNGGAIKNLRLLSLCGCLHLTVCDWTVLESQAPYRADLVMPLPLRTIF